MADAPKKPTRPASLPKASLPKATKDAKPTPPGVPISARDATAAQPAGKRTPAEGPKVASGTLKPNLPGARKPKLPARPGGDGASRGIPKLTRKDFATDQDVRWCPGCGDYAILATVQRLLPELGVARENTVFISGIGCSSRFPYYMNTYGMHSIHGRAPAIVTGLKATRPDLDVWVITGDGDALSIGGNHLIHLLRRNVDTQLLLFNNQIYGLTKGQFSPTSEKGKVTKSTPFGSVMAPFNPPAVALGADGTFVARTMDRDPKHMKATLKAAHEHTGTAFVEIYQNCNIFNDGAFFDFTEKGTKSLRSIFVEHGQPLTFDGGKQGLRLADGLKLEVVDLERGDWSADDCLVHDATSRIHAGLLADLTKQLDMPRPFGVFYREERPAFDALFEAQRVAITEKLGQGDLGALLNSGETWEIG